ncbi:hypothetical protein FRC07_009549, partial [Ceratobasidium sp. 392]
MAQPGPSSIPPYEADVPLKIRRVTKACDLCRKRKARCDGDPASTKPVGGPTIILAHFARYAKTRASAASLRDLLGNEDTRAGQTPTFLPTRKSNTLPQRSHARLLETRIIELEGIIRLMAPGIDIEQEMDESTPSPGDTSAEFLRPSDSAFLHPSDAFLRPSPDSTSAFFHPYAADQQETKPDVSALAGLQPISPPMDEYAVGRTSSEGYGGRVSGEGYGGRVSGEGYGAGRVSGEGYRAE